MPHGEVWMRCRLLLVARKDAEDLKDSGLSAADDFTGLTVGTEIRSESALLRVQASSPLISKRSASFAYQRRERAFEFT